MEGLKRDAGRRVPNSTRRADTHDVLYVGVEKALLELGNGFLQHPDNEELRAALRAGHLNAVRYHAQLVRLIYRFLFLFVMEARGLSLDGAGGTAADGPPYPQPGSVRWREGYRVARRGDSNTEWWEEMKGDFRHDRRAGAAGRFVPAALGMEIFGAQSCLDLEAARCDDERMRAANTALSTCRNEEGRACTIAFGSLDAEAFGSIHERLLGIHPSIEWDPIPQFALTSGLDRKRTGSFYTPPALIREIIQSALVPVLDARLAEEATAEGREAALLGIRLCDPACGCGHFLLAAARHLAHALTRVRSETSPGHPNGYRRALRDVLASCLFGVDKDALAVDICKLALWVETDGGVLPGVLNGRIKAGDSLVGVMNLGVLDDDLSAGRLARAADLWTASFFCSEHTAERAGTTMSTLPRPIKPDGDIPAGEEKMPFPQYQFFHWPLEFPQVFAGGGFDVVIGNPPWEGVELKEVEYFARRAPTTLTGTTGAARKQAIASLERSRPDVYAAYLADLSFYSGLRRFLRASGRYALTGAGRVNLYGVFAETMRALLRTNGRAGMLVPTGIATDLTNRAFFEDLITHRALVSLYDFENRNEMFAGVHRSYKFSLVTLTSDGAGPPCADFACFLRRPTDLAEADRHFALSSHELALLNPNTRTLSIFRGQRDAELTKSIYCRVPVLARGESSAGNPWGMTLRQGHFNMTSDSSMFRTRRQLEEDGWRLEGNSFVRGTLSYLPLYEAKMVHSFDHRWATYQALQTHVVTAAEKAQPKYVVLPRYWVREDDLRARQSARAASGWHLVSRMMAPSTNERTLLATLIPDVAVGNSAAVWSSTVRDSRLIASLAANLGAFVLDYAVRQKVGGSNLNFFLVEQFPILPPYRYQEATPWSRRTMLADWICARVVELVYTSWDMQPVARALGYAGPPIRWDEEHRFRRRCELDAAFFHLYGVTRDDVEYVLRTFPIVRRRDEAAWGDYRTLRVIMNVYDDMQRAMDTDESWTGACAQSSKTTARQNAASPP